MDLEHIKELTAQMEAILFAAGEPVGVEQICKGLDMTRVDVDHIMATLIQRYEFEQRGIRIIKLDSSYQMCSAFEHASTIRSILESRVAPKLSQPALEVLAIIAYHQPTTRIYVDQVRGVDSAYTVGLLVERGLLEECGKLKDVPGRPTLYRTTKAFLRSFHMESIKDLPDLGKPEPENVQLSIEQRLKELEQSDEADLEKEKTTEISHEKPEMSLEDIVLEKKAEEETVKVSEEGENLEEDTERIPLSLDVSHSEEQPLSSEEEEPPT